MINSSKFLAGSLLIILLLLGFTANAEESVCAQVKMEITQQASLERQAFDAVMRINNGLETVSLTNISIYVNFSDELGNTVLASSNPDDTEASFFIRIDTMQEISDVSGNGEVLANTTAEIHWLIIPAPGSGGSLPSGKLYNVGATLDYNLDGEAHSIEVIPDTIYVKPLPKINLDYFLTKNVVSDDPFTPEVEPPQPFTLGVRVRNNGDAVARNFKIDSAQPKIVENLQGLLINFVIISSAIDELPAAPDLLLDFGDIPGQTARVGRWQMQTNLSGKFIEFTASYSHADELGGQLTSILEGVNSYFLLHDVEINLPGRDNVYDFLAYDDLALKVFESNSADSPVTDFSTDATFTFNRQEGDLSYYDLQIPESNGFVYARIADPARGQSSIQSILRSDNTTLPALNSWFSTLGATADEKENYINLFDYQTPGTYQVVLSGAEVASTNKSPSINFIAQQEVYADESLLINISASDPDNTIPVITALVAPVSGQFSDLGNGTATFQWTPSFSDIGIHQLVVKASDGILNSQRTIQINVLVPQVIDTDSDQMDDNWEMLHFSSLDRDGTGDYDNDGINDLQEYDQQSDPKEYFVTGLPRISFPQMGQKIDHLNPTLEIENASANLADRSGLSYQFELYADDKLTELVDSSDFVKEANSTNPGYTQWASNISLEDNHWYSWRARTFNDNNYSQWVMGYFFTNTSNDSPSQPLIFTPRYDAQPDTLSPLFEVSKSFDNDNDELSYQFLFFQDEEATIPLLSSEKIYQNESNSIIWQLGQDLISDSEFYWQVVVSDPNGGISHTIPQYLSFDLNNKKPDAPVITQPSVGQSFNLQEVNISILAASDPENDPLQYHFELDNNISFTSPDIVTTVISGDQQTFDWPVSNLSDNTHYYLRVRAFDGKDTSPWSIVDFTVNIENDAPEMPVIINPGQNSWLTTETPVLQIAPATDIDGDSLTYQFELYSDETLTTLLSSALTDKLNYSVTENLTIEQTYYWRVRSVDQQGAVSQWSETYDFIVNNNDIDIAEIKLLSPEQDTEVSRYYTLRWDDQDADSNASIGLYYSPTTDINDASPIITNLVENNDGKSDSYRWDVRDLPAGEYYILSTISNQNETIVAIAPGKIIKPAELILQTDIPSPQNQGTDIQLLALYDNKHTYEYRFMIKGETTLNEWVVLQDWSELNNMLWSSNRYPGNNTLRVDVRISTTQEILATSTVNYTINLRWSILSLFKNTDNKINDGQLVDLKAVFVSQIEHIEYQYTISGKTIIGDDQILRPWSVDPDYTWDSTGYVGSHKLTVMVREQGADTDTIPDLILKKKSLYFAVQKPQLELVGDTEKYIDHGQQVNLSTNIITGSNNYEYSYSIKGNSTDGEILLLQDWSTNPKLVWDSTQYIGHHKIIVSVRTIGTELVLKTASLGLVVNKPKIELSRDTEKIIQHAQRVNLAINLTSGLGQYEYRFIINGSTTEKQDVVIRDWSDISTMQWDSSNYIGWHSITAELRIVGSQEPISKSRLGFNVKKPKVLLTRDTEKLIEHGQVVNLQATLTQGLGNYEYRYLISGNTIEGEPLVLRDWSADQNYVWNSNSFIGYHQLEVQLREAGKTEILSTHKLGFGVQKPKIELLRDSEKIITLGQVVTLDTVILSGKASYEYRFRIKGKTTNDEYQLLQDWSGNSQYIWDSQAYQGWHQIEVSIRMQGNDEILRTKTLGFSVKAL